MMEISIIFKIAALGIVITVLGQVLKHSGREEMTFLLSLARACYCIVLGCAIYK